MKPYLDGRERLTLLAELHEEALRRLRRVMGKAYRRSRGDALLANELAAILKQDFKRTRAALTLTFGRRLPGPRPSRNSAALVARLALAHRACATALASFGDDNELDVRRLDAAGRRRPTLRLVERMVLDEAELAGRIAAAVRAVGRRSDAD